MRLISCHIENFGKISNQSFDFSRNCNQICQENGWGKSTLATFIRVMFYGFSGEGKRNDIENERKHFKPWQGGVYGGMLTFETNGKEYQIFRTFGTKEKDDVFVLRDAKTNLESKDFSNKIGEELFQIDAESFCRTVFISQNDCQTSTNGSINAKLGNLAENTDDINNFEKVDEQLKSLLNSMSPTRKQGSLYKLKDEIAQIERDVKQGILLDESIDELNQKIATLKTEKEDLQERLEHLQKKQKEISVYQDAKAQREKYADACKQLRIREQNLQEQKAYFPGQIPDENELNEQISYSDDLELCKESVRQSQLNEKEEADLLRLQKVFAKQIPTEADLQNYKNKAKEINELQLSLAQGNLTPEEEEKLAAYQQRIGEPIPKNHEILHFASQWGTRDDIKSKIPGREQEIQQYKEKIKENEQKANQKSALMYMGIVFALVGIGLLFVQVVLGCGLLGLGVILTIFGIYQSRTRKKTVEKENNEYKSQLHEMESKLSVSKGKMASVESKVKHFLQKYQMSYTEENVLAQIYEMKSQCQEYRNLLSKKEMLSSGDSYQNYQALKDSVEAFLLTFYPVEVVQKNPHMEVLFALEKHKELYLSLQKKKGDYEAAKERYQLLSQRLCHYLRDLSFAVEDSMRSQLLEIKEHLQQYKIAQQEYENAKRVKLQLAYAVGGDERFSNGNDFNNCSTNRLDKEIDSAESLEQLAGEMKTCSDRLQEIHESTSQYLRQLNMYQEKRTQIAEDEEQLEFLKEQYREGVLKYKRIEKTKEFLGLAKESFTAKYMEPIMSGFRKYYKVLTGTDASQYQIDANTQLTVKEQGLQRNPQLFSTGYQDLMGICMRMALVDAMYSQEKPFLIFDDPFVNLDAEKTKGGMEFLKEIAKEYQVVYFTCHESRCEK